MVWRSETLSTSLNSESQTVDCQGRQGGYRVVGGQHVERFTGHLSAVVGAETGEAGRTSYYWPVNLSKFRLGSPWGKGARV